MNTHTDKTPENKSQAIAENLPKQQCYGESTFQFVDNRPEAFAQRKMQEAINNKSGPKQLMKRSTRTHELAEFDNDEASETKTYTSGNETRTVHLGKLKICLRRSSDNETKRYDVLETLLEDIGGQSKGHDVITGNPDLLKIFQDVCSELSITVEWTGLNI